MTAEEILDRLGKGYRNYLNGDMKPAEGYDDKFYDGVLWAFARLTEIQPSDNEDDCDKPNNAINVASEGREPTQFIPINGNGSYDENFTCKKCGYQTTKYVLSFAEYCPMCGRPVSRRT